MANYAKITLRITRLLMLPGEIPLIFSLSWSGQDNLISESPVLGRQYSGEFTADGSDKAIIALRLAEALGADYTTAAAQIIQLPVTVSCIDDTVTLEANEYDCIFKLFALPDWIEVVENVSETPDVPLALEISGVTVQQADTADRNTHVRYNLSFLNATYPVQLTSPFTKTINSAAEAYYDYRRNMQSTGVILPMEDIEATDADGKVVTMAHPTADSLTFDPPSIVEQSPGFTVTAEYDVHKGNHRTFTSFKIDDGSWRALPTFYNVPIGQHTIYMKDNWGGLWQETFQAGELEERKIYLAGRDQRVMRTATITNPVHTPERVNIYVVLPALNKEIKRSLVPAETSPGVYEAEFDLNNLLDGELQDYLEEKERFSFPGDPSMVLRNRTNLLLEFYTDASYSYVDADGMVQESGRTDNATNTHHYAMRAGISKEWQGYLQGLDLTFDQWLTNGNEIRFVSWMPDNMPVHAAQPLRLWLLNNGAITNMRLMLNVTFTDGTSTGDFSRPVTSAGFGLFELACGPDELLLATLDITKTVAAYTVWLEGLNGAAVVRTEKKSFRLDHNTYERNDILFVPTSLGVHEVLWCKGRRSEEIETDQELNKRPLAAPSLTKGTIRGQRATYEQTYEMNTGYFPKPMRHYLLDFLTATEAVLPVGFFLRPVIIEKGRHDFGEDGKDLFAIKFKMQVAHTESHYAPLPDVPSPWGSFSDDFNLDFFI